MKKIEYEKKIFEAYIGTPAKFSWYQKAFEYFEKKGGKLSWYWNTWAMLGGFWYFLYRKQMKMALIVLFAALILGTILPMKVFVLSLLIIAVLIGGFGTFFVYQQYLVKREEVEAVIKEDEKRIVVMEMVGGTNPWAVPAAIFALVSLVLIIMGLFMMAGRSLQ
jgi:phosphatidylglycerophosphatase A